MSEYDLGGITIKEVIIFQTQVMMGAQFGRVTNKKATKEDIIIACLRLGWNDAFRHTSENIMDGEKSVLEKNEIIWRKTHKNPYDDFICGKILNQKVVLNAFTEFASSASTADKVKAVTNNYAGLEELFSDYKKTDGDRGLCFGHFQKMFNIAVKFYVCLYLCRKNLDISENLFIKELLDNIKNADCPIDSIILEKLANDTNNKEYKNHKWSKYGSSGHPIENYETVQKNIADVEATNGNSRLYYDFVAWKQ